MATRQLAKNLQTPRLTTIKLQLKKKALRPGLTKTSINICILGKDSSTDICLL